MKIGMICGRFQPIHLGHLAVINAALADCGHLIIAIGSAQEARTKRNPLSFEERKELILKCVPRDRVTIIGINDRETIADDASWGDYLLNEIYTQTGWRPSVNYTGTELIRSHWFDNQEIEQVEINRDIIYVSATLIRDAIRLNDYEAFYDMMPMELWSEYERLREIIK